jgi:hypothetical protein
MNLTVVECECELDLSGSGYDLVVALLFLSVCHCCSILFVVTNTTEYFYC